MNTGVQRSSATPFGAWTTTTPGKRVKEQEKKDLLAVLVAHGIPYAATATVAYPDDFTAKFARARGIAGTRFIHLLSPCPPGWKIPSERAIEFAVKGMLPKTVLGRQMYRKLHVFAGGNHPHAAQQPKPLDLA